MKLSKVEQAAFAAAGAAICSGKKCTSEKKDALKLLAAVLADEENHKELLSGVTIGNYRFTIVQRDELTAIEV